MSFEAELKQRAEKVNRILDNYHPTGDVPPLLKDAMEYSLKAGGKRIRPVLLLETVNICNGPIELAYPIAAALEMIHTYSLIHDDLPAMDDDELRRGRPTNHVVFGEGIAILAGDGLLNCAFQTMLEHIPYDSDMYLHPYLNSITEITRASGHNGMVAGQVMDIISEGKEPDKDMLEYIHKHKTGALLRASIRAGAILANCGEEDLEALTRYAEAIGLAFQLADDILDIKGDKSKLGKSTGKDTVVKKLTYPLVYGLDNTYKKIQELYKEAQKYIKYINTDTSFLLQMANFICNRDY
jgi:geranylgeranyl diphosphate synthase type II